MALSVDIQKRLGDFQLNVQFEANNERLALFGASGCGKTVTLRCIAGTMTPDEGTIVLDGITLFDSTRKINLPPQKRNIGYLFQQYALFPHMTVRQNIAAAVRDRTQRLKITDTALRQFQLLDAADLKPHQLSGGQQQRTALARMLASEPSVLLLDEPFSALDSYLKDQLEADLLETLDAFPGTVLWVSHDRGEIFRSCQRVCVMDRGSTQPVRTMKELFHAPDTESAARLSGCRNFADANPSGHTVTIPKWNLTLDCGRPVSESVHRIGIRSIHLASPEAKNAFSCRVVRVVEDLSSMIILLRPENAIPEAPLLRMEANKETWSLRPQSALVSVVIKPQDILLLQDM